MSSSGPPPRPPPKPQHLSASLTSNAAASAGPPRPPPVRPPKGQPPRQAPTEPMTRPEPLPTSNSFCRASAVPFGAPPPSSGSPLSPLGGSVMPSSTRPISPPGGRAIPTAGPLPPPVGPPSVPGRLSSLTRRPSEASYTLLSSQGVPVALVPRDQLGNPQQGPASSSPLSSATSASSSSIPSSLPPPTPGLGPAAVPAGEWGQPWSRGPELTVQRDQEYELSVHLVDCSTSMWKSNKWFGPKRIEETKRLIMNNIHVLSSAEDQVVRFSCLVRFSGVPVKGSKEAATVLVPVMLHDLAQKERFMSVARLQEPSSSELDEALAPEAGTRILSALLWVENNIISPWLGAYGPLASATRVMFEVYTDGKTGDPVLDMPPEVLDKYQSVFDKSHEQSPSLRSSILYAFGEDLDTAKKICYRTKIDSLVMVPDVDTAIRERDEIIYRVRSTKASRASKADGDPKTMIGFRYGDTRAEQIATKSKGLKHICYYIMNNPKILDEEGIFRIPGRASVIAKYVDLEKNQILAPPSLEELDEMDPHTACGVLKAWLKAPPVVLPFPAAQKFTQILQRRQGMQVLIEALQEFATRDPVSYEILQILLRLFYEVHLRSSSNQMKSELIATVFAPSLIECPTIDDMSASTSMLTQLIDFSPTFVSQIKP